MLNNVKDGAWGKYKRGLIQKEFGYLVLFPLA